MRFVCLFMFLLCLSNFLFSQTYKVHFEGSRIYYSNVVNIDSIVATNINLGTSVNIYANEYLVIEPFEATKLKNIDDHKLLIYPNPFTESCNFSFKSPHNARASFDIYNLNGQLIHKEVFNLTKSIYTFNVSGLKYGGYIIYVKSDKFFYSGSFFSMNESSQNIKIKLVDSYSSSQNNNIEQEKSKTKDLKDTNEIPKLLYRYGDVFLFHVYSAENDQVISTLVIDENTPPGDLLLKIEFAKCKDANDNVYPVVYFGNNA